MYAVCNVVTPRETFKDLIDHVSLQNNLRNNDNTSLYHCTTQKRLGNFLVSMYLPLGTKIENVRTGCFVCLG